MNTEKYKLSINGKEVKIREAWGGRNGRKQKKKWWQWFEPNYWRMDDHYTITILLDLEEITLKELHL